MRRFFIENYLNVSFCGRNGRFDKCKWRTDNTMFAVRCYKLTSPGFRALHRACIHVWLLELPFDIHVVSPAGCPRLEYLPDNRAVRPGLPYVVPDGPPADFAYSDDFARPRSPR